MTDSAALTNPAAEDTVEWLPRTLADRRIRYGMDSQQFGDLRLPKTPAPEGGYPVVVVIHGGGYSPNWGYDPVSLLSESLTAAGDVATWNIEYRKPGQIGGGWPGTWLDIAAGIDHVRELAKEYPLNLDRVVALGHSAGGTFIGWAAGRPAPVEGSDVYTTEPLPLAGLVHLAPMLDLDVFMKSNPRNLSVLLGAHEASADEVEARIAEVSPMRRRALVGIPQAVVIGTLDDPGMIEASRVLVDEAQERGVVASYDYLDGANHFDMIDPTSSAWLVIAARTLDLCGIEDSPERAERIAAQLTAY